MKVVDENFRQLLHKVLCLWRKQIYVYIDEDFAINRIRPKFLSLLMTGIIRIGMTERGRVITGTFGHLNGSQLIAVSGLV